MIVMNYRIEYCHKKQDFLDVWNIEKQYLEPSTISSVEQVIDWNNKNNDTHIFVRDLIKDKIVGEITFLPLSKEQFNKFMIGELEDTEIDGNNLYNYEDGKSYYLLFSAIAIDKDYRNDRRILSLLLKGFNDKLNELINRNITFLNMCAEGQTPDGQKFIENFLNLKYQQNTKEDYKLYSFDTDKEFDDWLKAFPKYIEEYNNNLVFKG